MEPDVGKLGRGDFGVFDEQGADRKARRLTGCEVSQQKSKGEPGIDNVLHDKDVTTGEVCVEVLHDPYDAARAGAAPIRGDSHEVELDR